jgi:hypothetical protein
MEVRQIVPNEERLTAWERWSFRSDVGEHRRRASVNNIIWIIGAIVVVLAILSFLGLR